MTDEQYDVLDELYFIISFDQLRKELDTDQEKLKEVLKQLLKKGWVKCFANVSEELLPEEADMDTCFHHYFYLATKAGLLAHNGR